MNKTYITNLLIIGCVLLVIIGCGELAFSERESSFSTTYLKESMDGFHLDTFEHDGHKFVVLTKYKGGGLVHHPDCPCGKY